MKVLQRLLACVVSLLIVTACGKADRVATVGGRDITRSELEAYLKHKNIPATDEGQVRGALAQYAEREALAKAIDEAKLLDSKAIEVELAEFRKELLISRYFEQYLREQVSDQAVLNFYNGNPGKYEEERVHVAHILFRTRRDMDESERQSKLTAAQDAYAKLTAGGDFAAIAGAVSDDQVSGKRGGDLGWLKRGAVSQVFSDRIFGLKEGEVSEPFETPFGFHVAKVIEKPQTIRRPFDSVKGDIRYQLRGQAKDTELKRLLEVVKVDIPDGQKLAVARSTSPAAPATPAPAGGPAAPSGVPGTRPPPAPESPSQLVDSDAPGAPATPAAEPVKTGSGAAPAQPGKPALASASKPTAPGGAPESPLAANRVPSATPPVSAKSIEVDVPAAAAGARPAAAAKPADARRGAERRRRESRSTSQKSRSRAGSAEER